MKTSFSSLTLTFDLFSNPFESSCFIKTDEKLIFWRITFRMSYWISIKRFNWVWILIKKFFNFDLFNNSLRIYHARMSASKIRSLNANCKFSTINFFWRNSLNENQHTINPLVVSHWYKFTLQKWINHLENENKKIFFLCRTQ